MFINVNASWENHVFEKLAHVKSSELCKVPFHLVCSNAFKLQNSAQIFLAFKAANWNWPEFVSSNLFTAFIPWLGEDLFNLQILICNCQFNLQGIFVDCKSFFVEFSRSQDKRAILIRYWFRTSVW